MTSSDQPSHNQEIQSSQEPSGLNSPEKIKLVAPEEGSVSSAGSDSTAGDALGSKELEHPASVHDGKTLVEPVGTHNSPASDGAAMAERKEEPDSTGSALAKAAKTQGDKAKKQPGGPMGLVREVAELIVVTLVLLIGIRWLFAEARYIPSSSMEPTLQIEDRLLVEKVSGHLGKPIRRGDILVFYPPPSEMPGGKDLSSDPLTVLGRLTGLPFLPYEPAFIKRVIGLQGDKIRIKRGVGVFVNDQLLDEPYIKEPPSYDLNVMGDIGGRTNNGYLRPYGESQEPIIVPAGKLFMMGDNRNNSEDSHVWGFLEQKRVIGRACLLFWRWLEPPTYPRSIDGSD